MRAFLLLSAFLVGRPAETYLVYAIGLQLRVGCESVAIEASVDSFRFDVASGVVVAASEEYAVGFIVG